MLRRSHGPLFTESKVPIREPKDLVKVTAAGLANDARIDVPICVNGVAFENETVPSRAFHLRFVPLNRRWVTGHPCERRRISIANMARNIGSDISPTPVSYLAVFLATFFAVLFLEVFFAGAFFGVALAISSESAVTPDFFRACWNHVGFLP